MRKYFVVSDVHGFYDELMSSLDKAGFDSENPNHIFVSCGDLMDRGHQPLECLEFVMSLPDNRRILVRGNHEDLLEEIMKQGFWQSYDKSNGTYLTMKLLLGVPYISHCEISQLRKLPILNKYLNSLVNYGEINKYIFVHSWYPWTMENWRDATRDEWEEFRWKNPFTCWEAVQRRIELGLEDKLGKDLGDKTLVFGHWHTSWAHAHISGLGIEFPETKWETLDDCHFEPFYGSHIIGIDACTAFTKKVNCIVLEE